MTPARTCGAVSMGSTRSRNGAGVRICGARAKFHVVTAYRDGGRYEKECCGRHARQARRIGDGSASTAALLTELRGTPHAPGIVVTITPLAD